MAGHGQKMIKNGDILKQQENNRVHHGPAMGKSITEKLHYQRYKS